MSPIESETWLPLFPLQLVLLPEERLPLHIFEEKYKAMLRRCREESLPFVIAQQRNEGVLQVGCTAQVQQTFKEHSDGRSDILVRGRDRVRVQEVRVHSDGYAEARVDPYPDQTSQVDDRVRQALRQLFEEFLKVQAVHGGDPVLEVESIEDVADDEVERTERAGDAGFTFRVAARCPLDLQDRQALLEDASEPSRAEALIRILAKSIPKIRQLQEDQVHVRGNGRITHGPGN